jgi:hypothetical protein
MPSGTVKSITSRRSTEFASDREPAAQAEIAAARPEPDDAIAQHGQHTDGCPSAHACIPGGCGRLLRILDADTSFRAATPNLARLNEPTHIARDATPR